MLKDHEQEDLLHKIYIGEYDVTHLPTSFYLRVANELQDELYKGFGTDNKEEEQKTLLRMRRNVYYFSAAKTYQMVRAIKEKGKDKYTFSAYKQSTCEILGEFVGAYLFAEKDHTLQIGKQGKKWAKVAAKKETPFLEYVTKKDNRVRPTHVLLDGIIRKANDKFWDTFMPPNGWMCRCRVKSYPKGEDTDLTSFDMDEALVNVPQMFRRNFGKEGIVFPHDHPYFKVKDKELARRNFNLPLPHEQV